MDQKLISIIVPSYKQEKTIVRDLKSIHQILSELRYTSEIICVVDGMTDKTFEKASKYTKTINDVKVVGYETNKGKGYAVRFGMAESSGDIVGFIDAGMDLNPNGLSMLLEHFEWYNADIIVGSKRHPASKVDYPWQRRLYSLGYQLLVAILFGLRIRDTQVGMKFYKRSVLTKVLPRLIIKHFAFDIEILAVANYLGFNRIYEAPVEVTLDFRGNSGITNNKLLNNIFKMMLDTLAVFYRLRLLRYYDDHNQHKWIYDPELNFRVNL